MSKQYYRTVWMSDLHLGTKNCKDDLLLHTLDSFKCDYLYLVGDILDAWESHSFYLPQSHVNIIRKFLSKAGKGTKVFYVIGNHDEFLRQYLDVLDNHSIGDIRLANEFVHQTLCGKTLWITHGDLYDCVTRYHKWISYIGDWAYTLLLDINHHFTKIRNWLGYPYWSLSAYIKRQVKSAVNFINQFEQILANECHKKQYDGVVCGHIHHPEIKMINDVLYMNCGDFVESCSMIVEHWNGKIEIIHVKSVSHTCDR